MLQTKAEAIVQADLNGVNNSQPGGQAQILNKLTEDRSIIIEFDNSFQDKVQTPKISDNQPRKRKLSLGDINDSNKIQFSDQFQSHDESQNNESEKIVDHKKESKMSQDEKQKLQTQSQLKRMKTYENFGGAKIQKELSIDIRSKVNQFDGETIPADFSRARAHRLASKVGPEKDINVMKEDDDIGYCDCCARQIQRTHLSIKCNIYELSFLGSGYPLYFQFMKQCISLLLLVLFFSGLFNMVTNILGREKCSSSEIATQTDDQSEVVCKKGGWVSLFSLGSKSEQKTFMEIQGYLNLVSLIAMMFLLQFFRKLQRELDTKCDAEDISANDYTLIVQNIPIDFEALNDDYDDDLKEYLKENALEEKEVEIESVTLCYNLKEIDQLEKKKKKLIQIKQRYLSQHNDFKKTMTSYSVQYNLTANQTAQTRNTQANSFTNCLTELKQGDLESGGENKIQGAGNIFNQQNKARSPLIGSLQKQAQLFSVMQDIKDSQKLVKDESLISNLNQKNKFRKSSEKQLPDVNQIVSVNNVDKQDVLIQIEKSKKTPSEVKNEKETKKQLGKEAKQKQKQLALFKKKSKQMEYASILNSKLLDIAAKMFKINGQINQITNKIKVLNEKLMDGKGREFMKKYFTGIAFVCLKFEQDKEDIIDRYRSIGCFDKLLSKTELKPAFMNYKGQLLSLEQAPDPTDVNWVNLQYSSSEKFKRRLQGFFFTATCLLGCAFLIYLFHSFQESELEIASSQTTSSSNNSIRKQIISAMLAILISLLNALLSFILKVTSDYCKYSTNTDTNIFIAKGLSVARFINSALISFFIQIILSNKDTQETLFGEGGLAENANYFMISNSFATAIVQLLNLNYYWLCFLRFLEEKKGDKSVLTQTQLNNLYENPQFPIEERYAQLLMTMFTTAFYCPIVPMTIFWSLIGIFLQYWIDKYKLINRCSVRYNMSAALSIEMTEHLEYFLPIQSISTLIFYQYVNGGSWGVSSIIGTALGWLHAFLPMQQINERFFQVEKAEANVLDYDGAQKFFITDYSRENPIYKAQARETHVMKMNAQVSNQKSSIRINSERQRTLNFQNSLEDINSKKHIIKSFISNDGSECKEQNEKQQEDLAKVNKNYKNRLPPQEKTRIILSHLHDDKGTNNGDIANIKTQETFVSHDEDLSIKNAPQITCGSNAKRSHYMNSIKGITNETNLGLIEEEGFQTQSNNLSHLQLVTNSNQNTQNTNQNTNQNIELHMNTISSTYLSNLIKKSSFGPSSGTTEYQPKKENNVESADIQSPTHPLPRSSKKNGFSDAVDSALTERETFRACRLSSSKQLESIQENENPDQQIRDDLHAEPPPSNGVAKPSFTDRQQEIQGRESLNRTQDINGIHSDFSARPLQILKENSNNEFDIFERQLERKQSDSILNIGNIQANTHKLQDQSFLENKPLISSNQSIIKETENIEDVQDCKDDNNFPNILTVTKRTYKSQK